MKNVCYCCPSGFLLVIDAIYFYVFGIMLLVNHKVVCFYF